MRTVPPYFQQAEVWVELLTHFGWRQVIFIHGMDEEGRAILSRFQALAEQEEIKVRSLCQRSMAVIAQVLYKCSATEQWAMGTASTSTP